MLKFLSAPLASYFHRGYCQASEMISWSAPNHQVRVCTIGHIKLVELIAKKSKLRLHSEISKRLQTCSPYSVHKPFAILISVTVYQYYWANYKHTKTALELSHQQVEYPVSNCTSSWNYLLKIISSGCTKVASTPTCIKTMEILFNLPLKVKKLSQASNITWQQEDKPPFTACQSYMK